MVALSDKLKQQMTDLTADLAPARRVLVAVSGGLDSIVLLHLLKQSWTQTPIVALHVDHGLNPASPAWAALVERCARTLEVPCQVVEADVDASGGLGPEGAARAARHRVFESVLDPGDWLLTAHHQDDQAETFLLNALRGSGPRGLKGIPARRRCGAGWLLRPLLDVPRAELAAYARAAQLEWHEDPANADLRLDRNLLRHRALPLLAERWPHAAEKLAKSAALAGSHSALLDEVAAADLEHAGVPGKLRIDVLSELSAARQRNLLRFALRQLRLPPAPASALERIVNEVIRARRDAEPLVEWRGGQVRRHRDALYLLTTLGRGLPAGTMLETDAPVELGEGLGSLRLDPGQPGIAPELVQAGLAVRFREGGERLQPTGSKKTRRLKSLLQEAGIVPWMRARIPLLMIDQRLVAVGDLWVDESAYASKGYAVRWDSRPALN